MIAALPAAALEVWDGPLTNFTKPNFANSLDPINQDRITPNVWLTRDTTRGIYNIAVEFSYISYYSPEDTEWAYGTLDDYDALAYSDWETWNGHNPPSMVGQDAVAHLISDDIYMSIKFTSWGMSQGGFSYQRSTPNVVPEPSGVVLFALGLILAGVASLHRSTTAVRMGRCRVSPAHIGSIPCMPRSGRVDWRP
jgi:hypothetical protein